ncbi:hypothetical protein SLA2020_521880 [Shorea laevis]
MLGFREWSSRRNTTMGTACGPVNIRITLSRRVLGEMGAVMLWQSWLRQRRRVELGWGCICLLGTGRSCRMGRQWNTMSSTWGK